MQGNGLGESSAPTIPEFVPQGDQAILGNQVLICMHPTPMQFQHPGIYITAICPHTEQHTLTKRTTTHPQHTNNTPSTHPQHTNNTPSTHTNNTQFQQQDDALDLISAAMDHLMGQASEWNGILSDHVERMERIEANADESDMRFKNLNKTMKK